MTNYRLWLISWDKILWQDLKSRTYCEIQWFTFFDALDCVKIARQQVRIVIALFDLLKMTKCSYLLGKLILLLVVLQLISVMQLSAANNSNSNSNSGNSRSGNNNDSSNSSNNKGNNSNGNNSNSNSNSTSSRGNSGNNNGNSNSRSGNSNSNGNSGSNRGNNGKGGNSASATTASPKNADYDKIIRALCVNDLPQDKHDAFNKCLDNLIPSVCNL